MPGFLYARAQNARSDKQLSVGDSVAGISVLRSKASGGPMGHESIAADARRPKLAMRQIRYTCGSCNPHLELTATDGCSCSSAIVGGGAGKLVR